MARERMVTRTINATVCTVMGVTVSTATVSNSTITISGIFDNDKDLLKALKKVYETDDYKIATVVKTEVQETLYGMPETEFMKYAKVLPPRGTKEEQ